MEYKYYNNAAVMVVKIDLSNLPIHLMRLERKRGLEKGEVMVIPIKQILKRALEIRLKTRKSYLKKTMPIIQGND